MSRAVRRHHEERIKAKWLKIATTWAGPIGHWVHVWDHRWDKNSVPGFIIHYSRHRIDFSRVAKREQSIHRNMTRRAHHPQHHCNVCHPSRYDRVRERRAYERATRRDWE